MLQTTTLVSALALGAALACGGGTPTPNATPETEPNAPTESTTNSDTTSAGDAISSPSTDPASPGSAGAALQTSTDRDTNTTGAGAAGARLSDPQIALITESVNSAEIEQARLAQDRAKDERVRQFASMMTAHHSDARKKQSELKLDEAESPLSRQLVTESKATLEQLRTKVGADFDRAYMQAQVEAHQKALSTIQNDLRPNARHADLRAYLEELAPQVSQHLEQARATQQALEGAANSQTPDRTSAR
jgi:putative membrane protein